MDESERSGKLFSVSVEERDGICFLRLVGELDMATAPRLATILQERQGDPSGQRVIDLRGLTFLDSTGLALFVKAHKARHNGSAPVRFIAGNENVQRVFQLTKTDDELEWVAPD